MIRREVTGSNVFRESKGGRDLRCTTSEESTKVDVCANRRPGLEYNHAPLISTTEEAT